MDDLTVGNLLDMAPFTLPQQEKEARLVPVITAEMSRSIQGCPRVQDLARKQRWDLDACQRCADIPFIPVSMFKLFELRSVPAEQVVRELNSSSTTGQLPSRIFIDKETAFRQARALTIVLKDFLGGHRRPFLVLDVPEVMHPEASAITARGAAVRGIANFASSTSFAMRQCGDGAMKPDLERIQVFFDEHGHEEVLLFGFTFMVWKHLVLPLEREGLQFSAAKIKLLHSGGWKKLVDERVSKETFAARTATILSCAPNDILDFYGMVEQVGTVFVDCEAGNKHSPVFADVVIRDPLTLRPVPAGQEGLIHVLSALPSSYPGHSLMTEDQGRVLGIDDCPCGRRGMYFRFTSRVERVEIRGCGDTYATRQVMS